MIVRVGAGMARRHRAAGRCLQYYRRAPAPMTMLYESYQAQEDVLAPWRSLAVAGGEILRTLPDSVLDSPWTRPLRAGAEIPQPTARRHTRLPFGIESVQVDGRQVAVHEEALSGSPF